ncbi:hypothetical protein [Phenylobacterium sp.]|uniref:hypothetical protein n=1 Tax=Phenylobacterium sp. TaxID=1871053 RepID=UPI003569A262
MRLKLNHVWPSAKSQVEWFAVFINTLAEHPDGFFFDECTTVWFELDGELDGVRLDPKNVDDDDKARRALDFELGLFTHFKVLSAISVPPRDGAYTRSLKFRLLDLPKFHLTKKGKRLSRAGTTSQRFAFARMLLVVWAQPAIKALRVAIPALGGVFTLLKVVLQWEADKALIGGVIAGIVGFIASIIPRSS